MFCDWKPVFSMGFCPKFVFCPKFGAVSKFGVWKSDIPVADEWLEGVGLPGIPETENHPGVLRPVGTFLKFTVIKMNGLLQRI